MNLRLTASRLVVALLGLATGTGVVGAHGGNDTHYDGHMWDGHMAGDWGHMGVGGGWMVLWGLIWTVVVIAAVAAVIYWLAGGRGGREGGDDEAMAALRQQYARGEIDHEEFEERRRRLQE